MNSKNLIACMAILVLVSACNQQAEQPAVENAATEVEENSPAASIADVTLPATTSSDTARDLYMAGWVDNDNARQDAANKKFLAAAEADPSFAMAHLMAAMTATSAETFAENLRKASANSENVSPAEQLIIKSMEQAFDGDAQGMIESRLEITKLLPDSPRAWNLLGFAYADENNSTDARAAFGKAIALDPSNVSSHTNLGNNLMTQEPKDFAGAEQHFKHAVAITPNEPNPHDLLGDVHRAQGNLKAAYKDYTKAAELAPELGSALQQRGHVNSFMGKYDDARADYTRSAELEDARGSNAGGTFLVYRAYVSAHQGDLAAAVAELQALAASADGAYSEGVTDLKVNALSNAALFATEAGDSETASALIAEAASLMRAQAADIESDAFRDYQEATIAYMEGLLMARMGDTAGATAKAADFEQHLASSTSPRKLERMHEILGMSAYYQDDFAGAAKHLSAGDTQSNMYTKYYLSKAHEAAGNADEAARLNAELAAYNFNGPGYAMFRKAILKSAAPK